MNHNLKNKNTDEKDIFDISIVVLIADSCL